MIAGTIRVKFVQGKPKFVVCFWTNVWERQLEVHLPNVVNLY